MICLTVCVIITIDVLALDRDAVNHTFGKHGGMLAGILDLQFGIVMVQRGRKRIVLLMKSWIVLSLITKGNQAASCPMTRAYQMD